MSLFRAKTTPAWLLGIGLVGLLGVGIWQLRSATSKFLADPRYPGRLREMVVRTWPKAWPGHQQLVTRMGAMGQCVTLQGQQKLQGEPLFGLPLVLRKDTNSPSVRVGCATKNFGFLEIDGGPGSALELIRSENQPITVSPIRGDLGIGWRGTFSVRVVLPETSFEYVVTKAKEHCSLQLNWDGTYLLNLFSSCSARITFPNPPETATYPALRFISENDAELSIGDRKLTSKEYALFSGSGIHFLEKQ